MEKSGHFHDLSNNLLASRTQFPESPTKRLLVKSVSEAQSPTISHLKKASFCGDHLQLQSYDEKNSYVDLHWHG